MVAGRKAGFEFRGDGAETVLLNAVFVGAGKFRDERL